MEKHSNTSTYNYRDYSKDWKIGKKCPIQDRVSTIAYKILILLSIHFSYWLNFFYKLLTIRMDTTKEFSYPFIKDKVIIHDYMVYMKLWIPGLHDWPGYPSIKG